MHIRKIISTPKLLFMQEPTNSGLLQIRIHILLVSGYQPRLTKFQVIFQSLLNLPFLPQITNEKISDMRC